MTSLPRIMSSHLLYLLVVSFFSFRSIVSEGVAANCTQPSCQDELEAAACPPDSIPDVNSPSNGCICANKCPPPPTCIPPAVSRLQRPATGEPSNCCDLYECVSPQERNCSQVICDNIEQVPCPPDSYRLPAIKSLEECCSVPQGCQCLPEPCRPLECEPPLWAKVVRPGDQKPGSCCPLYKCVENESNETCTLDDGAVVSDGATWEKSECLLCSCKNGVVVCDKNPPCPPLQDSCTKTNLPKGTCCPICLEAPEHHEKNCLSGKGEIIRNGESWQEDDCTFCVCLTGDPSCQAYMCEACANPRYVPHECCPLCDESSVVTLPPHCPELTNCSLRCVHGFVRDAAGCFTCDCQQDVCVLECPQGYAEDKHGNKLCECAKPAQCPSLNNCKKKCLHGFRLNKAGCPQCKCDSCKHLECLKKCPHGLMMNKNNCPICKCLPAPSNTTLSSSISVYRGKMCTSDDVIFHDDGEMWYDGCRQCYCLAGIEMCSPLLCPPTNCSPQLLNTSGCCPVCPGPQESIKRHMVCGGGEGRDSFRMEGEVWNISPDIKCACQNGRTLCHAPPCPPAPCHYQSMMTSELGCPHCSLQLLNSTFQLSTNCEGHEGMTVWRESNCVSCLCDGNKAECFSEVCSSEPCNHPLHLKGHCCPICLDSLSKTNKIPTFDVIHSSNEASHLGCSALLQNVTQLYNIGEEWQESDCVTCRCIGQGQTLCTKETCQFPSSCPKPVKTAGVCCHTCLNSEAGTGGFGHEMLYIVIVSVVICTALVVIFLIARQCRLRRQMKLPKYGCPPPQYHQYKFVPSYETPQSQSIRTTEKSALSPV